MSKSKKSTLMTEMLAFERSFQVNEGFFWGARSG